MATSLYHCIRSTEVRNNHLSICQGIHSGQNLQEEQSGLCDSKKYFQNILECDFSELIRENRNPSTSVRTEFPGKILKKYPHRSFFKIFTIPRNFYKILPLCFGKNIPFLQKIFSNFPALQFWHILKIKTPCQLSEETIRCRK